MRNEVIQGILGGLVAIVIVVSIGSFIAQSLSHSHAAEGGHGAEEHAPAEPAEEAAADNAAEDSAGAAKEGDKTNPGQ